MEMNLLTIKEYAAKKHVSYEAVRKQIQKYKDGELKEHIIRKNKTQYLDEYAVEFLDNRRRESPVMVIQMDKDEEIERLERENKVLLLKITELQDALLKEKDTVKKLQEEKIKFLQQTKTEVAQLVVTTGDDHAAAPEEPAAYPVDSTTYPAETPDQEIVIDADAEYVPEPAQEPKIDLAKPEEPAPEESDPIQEALRQARIREIGLDFWNSDDFGFQKFCKNSIYDLVDLQEELVEICVLPKIKRQVDELIRMEEEYNGYPLIIKWFSQGYDGWKAGELRKDIRVKEYKMQEFMVSNTFKSLSDAPKDKIIAEIQRYSKWSKKRF